MRWCVNGALSNQKNATAVAEDVMYRKYLLFHKALKDAADDFDFEEVRIQRKMFTFILCIHFILEEKKKKGDPYPFVKTMEIYRALKYFSMEYKRPIIYNYVAKLERMNVLEKVAKRSRIGKPQAFVTTNIGDYLLTHVNNHFERALLDDYDFSPKSTLGM